MLFRIVVFLLVTLSLVAKDSPVTLVGQISIELKRLNSPVMTRLVEKEIDVLWSIKDDATKLTGLKAILDEVKALKLAGDDAAVGVDKINVDKEVALCNYLVQQACLLEALEGEGVGIIKNELTGNFNSHGLSRTSQRLLRRLVALCEEAERGYNNVTYVKVDGSEAKASLLSNSLGLGVGASLALGDFTPLIGAAIRMGQGYSNINKEESRKLSMLIQSHQMRITNFLFNVNSWRNDLLAENKIAHIRFISPDVYREFFKVMRLAELAEKQNGLQKILEKHPSFMTARFYLAETYFQQKNWSEAGRLFKQVSASNNPLLHKDGFVGQAHTRQAAIAVTEERSSEAISAANAALGENSRNVDALHFKAQAELQLQIYDQAEKDAIAAHELLSDDAGICWTICKIRSSAKKESLNWLNKAVARGFNDLQAVKAWKPLERGLQGWHGRSLVQPQMSALYLAGILKDDIHIINNGRFDLEELKFSFVVEYIKKGIKARYENRGVISLLKRGKKVAFNNVISMKKSDRCKVTITFSSKQNPQEIISQTFYNYLGKQKNVPLWEYKTDSAWVAYKAPYDKTLLEKALGDAREGTEAVFYQNAFALSVWAHISFVLDKKDEARRLQGLAIHLLKSQLGEKTFKETCGFYIDAMKKFKKG